MIAALLIAVPAFAAEPPATILLPSNVVLALRQYLGARPFDETSKLIEAIEGCVQAQTPHNGSFVSHGECKAVTDEMAEQRKAVSDAEARGKAEAVTPSGH